MKFPKVIAALGLIVIPSFALADELDDVLDDLVETHSPGTIAAAEPAPQVTLTQVATVFKPVDSYQIDTPTRSEDSAAIEYRTTYVSLNGGASFEVRLVSPITKANFVLHGKMKETVVAYQQGLRAQPTKIQGASGGFLDAKENRAAGIALALTNDSYLIIRSSRSLDKKELVRFVESLGLMSAKIPNAV